MGFIHFDEKRISVGGRLYDDLNAIDSRTKFILAEEFVVRKNTKSVKKFLKQIKNLCYKQIYERYALEKNKPKEKRNLIKFICDGCHAFKKAWKPLFSRVATLEDGVPIACKKYGKEHNNNAIERYNREIKRRIIITGGIKSIEGARTLCSIRRIFYNFINPHCELKGKTPAEAAGIILDLKENKVQNLIWIATQNNKNDAN